MKYIKLPDIRQIKNLPRSWIAEKYFIEEYIKILYLEQMQPNL